MRIIKFIILITFLFNTTAYPYQNISDTLRSNLMTNEGKGAQRLQNMAAQVILNDTKPPSVGHVPVADAYDAAKAGNYDKAYKLLMEGLLGEDYVPNIETAIGVLRALQAHYGVDTQKGKELGGILRIVAEHKTARDQDQMKLELKQYQDSLKVVGAIKKKLHNYRPGWTFKGWKYAKKAIEERFKTTKERKEALKFVRTLAIRLADKGIDLGGDTLAYGIPAIAKLVKNIDELREILLYIENLAIRENLAIILADKKIHWYPLHYYWDTLQSSIPAIASVAKNIDELKLLMDLVIRLADRKVGYGILVIAAKLAKNIDELKEAILSIENLAIRLAEKGISATDTLESSIPAIANAAKNIDELKDMCDILFDLNIKDIESFRQNKIERWEIISFIGPRDIARAVELKKNYGDFYVRTIYGVRNVPIYKTEWTDIPGHISLTSVDWYYIDPDTGEYTYGDYSGYIEETVLARIDEVTYLRGIEILPLTHLTQLIATPVLFVDTEVVNNRAGFKEALKDLRNNEGNVPVVLLTQETKDSIIAKLEWVDLTGVQFRTQAELGLEDLKWSEDERVILIDRIDNLKCIPLTKTLCDAFKDLQKARDQV